MEQWKEINGYEGLYEVSDQGNVRNIKTGRILKLHSHNGYFRVHLTKHKKQKWLRVHRLVAIAFIPNPDNLETVDHINHDRTDNRVDNLRWLSHKNNCSNNQPRK